jgi:hypothetical protein
VEKVDAVDAVGCHGVALALHDSFDGSRSEWIFDSKTFAYPGERSVQVEPKDGVKAGAILGTTAVFAVAVETGRWRRWSSSLLRVWANRRRGRTAVDIMSGAPVGCLRCGVPPGTRFSRSTVTRGHAVVTGPGSVVTPSGGRPGNQAQPSGTSAKFVQSVRFRDAAGSVTSR